MKTGERFERAVEIMRRLRAPGGCPWDREQSYQSITAYTLEEAYEVVEAIEKQDFGELTGELGDLLLQVLFYAEMAQEENRFSIDEVLDTLCEKLIRRHPHVFGEAEAANSEAVLRNWEAIKQQERAARAAVEGTKPPKGLLDSVSTAMPALMESNKISKKAAHAGFDWPEIGGLFDKLTEETEELQAELAQRPAEGEPSDELQQRIQAEVGDLLFVAVNLARHCKVDPEAALRGTNRKFRRRFSAVEAGLRERGKSLAESDIEEMEALWQKAKQQEH
jgi:MazG family protein